jgi:hypothetical protein
VLGGAQLAGTAGLGTGMVTASELPLVHTNLGLQHSFYQEVKAYALKHHLEHLFEVRGRPIPPKRCSQGLTCECCSGEQHCLRRLREVAGGQAGFSYQPPVAISEANHPGSKE